MTVCIPLLSNYPQWRAEKVVCCSSGLETQSDKWVKE